MSRARASLRPLERSATNRSSRREQVWQLITLYRVSALVVAGVVLLTAGSALTPDARFAWLAFAVLALSASLIHRFALAIPAAALIVAETLAAALLLATAPVEASALALYLLVPAFWAGVVLWPFAAIVVAVLASALSIAVGLIAGGPADSVAPMWVALTLVAASLGVWTARLHQRRSNDEAAYERALGLLRELEEVTRRLPAGLDRSSVLDSSAAAVQSVRPDADVWIYSTQTKEWGPELGTAEIRGTAGTPWSPEWSAASHRRRMTTVKARVPGDRALLLFPLVHRDHVVGMVRITVQGTPTKAEVRRIEDQLASTAVRLLASSVFLQIRESAIAEERSRLSRNIHDGVAQDLAGLAFGLDAVAYGLPASSERDAVAQSAGEVRRLVEELRFSIFDLRTGLDVGDRLGSTLASYVYQVGERSGMRVNVEVDDVQAASIPAHRTHELLRIAQEAVTNARRHSGARSLWVVLRVADDGLLLRVADDGAGLTPVNDRQPGSHVGIAIMRERAERLGGSLSIRPRPGGGTVVECRVLDIPSDFVGNDGSMVNQGNEYAAEAQPAVASA